MLRSAIYVRLGAAKKKTFFPTLKKKSVVLERDCKSEGRLFALCLVVGLFTVFLPMQSTMTAAGCLSHVPATRRTHFGIGFGRARPVLAFASLVITCLQMTAGEQLAEDHMREHASAVANAAATGVPSSDSAGHTMSKTFHVLWHDGSKLKVKVH